MERSELFYGVTDDYIAVGMPGYVVFHLGAPVDEDTTGGYKLGFRETGWLVMHPVKIHHLKMEEAKGVRNITMISVTREFDQGMESYTRRRAETNALHPVSRKPIQTSLGWFLAGRRWNLWPQELILGVHKPMLEPEDLAHELSRVLKYISNRWQGVNWHTFRTTREYLNSVLVPYPPVQDRRRSLLALMRALTHDGFGD